jgi:hypothetical protein
VILHFGDWHGEPPLVSQVYSERVLASRVPLLLRGKLGRTTGIELYTFGVSARRQSGPRFEVLHLACIPHYKEPVFEVAKAKAADTSAILRA